MIKVVKTNKPNKGIVFPDMPLAKAWCKGTGLEIGASAHNPFSLPGCRNVAPDDLDNKLSPLAQDAEMHRQVQIDMCGGYAEIDLIGLIDVIPVEPDTQAYILTSHVIEHVPNPFKAFLEWNRVLKNGGIVFMIFPKRNADSADARKLIVQIIDLKHAFQSGVDNPPNAGHAHVYNLPTMIAAVRNFCTQSGAQWELVAQEATDSKVKNGHTLVFRVTKEAQKSLRKQKKAKKDGNPFSRSAKTKNVNAPDPVMALEG